MNFLLLSLSIACEHHLQTAQNVLVQLQAMISSGNSGLQHCLPHVNATLKKLVYTCDAASKMDTTGTITSFEDKENFSPGKKMDLQPRFTVTSNTPGRKKRKNVLQYVNDQFFYLHTVCLYIIATHTHTRYKLTNYTHTDAHTHTQHTSYIHTVHISYVYTH